LASITRRRSRPPRIPPSSQSPNPASHGSVSNIHGAAIGRSSTALNATDTRLRGLSMPARLALNLTPFKVMSISSGVALDHQLGPLSRPPREQEDRHAVQRRESEQPPAVVGVQCPARQQHGRNAEQQQRQWRGDRYQRQHRGQQPEAGKQPPHRPAALIGRRQPC
jgi:hypothetical protein